MKRNSKGFLIGGLAFLFLLCAGLAGWVIIGGRSRTALTFVHIQAPQENGIVDINDQMPLIVFAESNKPVLRLEVYADGALIAAANGTDENALTLSQTWPPATPGRHVLVARAFTGADEYTDSNAMFIDAADMTGAPYQVNIDSLPRAEGVTNITVRDLAEASGTTPEEIARLNPGMSAAPEASIPPGSPVVLPRRSSTPAGSAAPIPPPAPGAPGHDPVSPSSSFTGETHSCSSVTITWTDASDERSYVIYRLAPGEDAMSELARVSANTITYTDAPITRVGTYHYFLSPQRPSGGSISSMIRAVVGPECSPAGTAETAALTLSMLELTTREAVDGVYCYVSVNGSRYERVPAGSGFLRPTSGNLIYNLTLQLTNRGQYNLSVPTSSLVRLDGECWGRRGVESQSLGRFSGSHASPEWDGRDLIQEFAFRPGVELTSLNMSPSLRSDSYSIRYRIGRPGTFNLVEFLGGVGLQVPLAIAEPRRVEDMAIPMPTNVRLRRVPIGGCDYPVTDPDTVVCWDALEPRIAWDWSNEGQAGTDAYGFNVELTVIDTLNPSAAPLVIHQSITPGTARTAIPLAIPSRYSCSSVLRFTVSANTTRGTSAPSVPYEFRYPECPAANNIRVTIESLAVAPSARTGQVLDDGDICILCADRRLELNGWIDVSGSGASMASTPWGILAFGACPNSANCVNEGTYYWDRGPALVWLFQQESNAWRMPLSFAVRIMDYDWNYDRDGFDPFCVASHVLPARSPQEWARTNEYFTLTSDFGEAACTITVHVEGLP